MLGRFENPYRAGAIMSRRALYVLSWLVVISPAVGRADDIEDKAVAAVEKLGGTVPARRLLPC